MSGSNGHGRPGEPLLTIDEVECSYGHVQVLFGVSLEVREGERVALLGNNGAGKSTTLRVAAGLQRPSRGRVLFAGDDITGLNPLRIVRLGLLLIAAGRTTFPSLTVRENLQLAAYPVHRDRAQVRERLDETLATFPQLDGRLNQRAGTLSGGEQQIMALGRVLMARPRLLVIDELSLGLAPIVLQELLGMVAVLADRGMTMLIVEQSLNLAAGLAERAYFMENGTITLSGPMSDLLEGADLVRSVFYGSGSAPRDGRPGRAAASSRRP